VAMRQDQEKLTLSLYLLGPFRVQHGHSPAPVTLRRKTRDLLAYLAATGQTHERQALAELFCQDTAEPQRALRSVLSRIRRRVGRAALLSEGNTVRFNRMAAWVDCLALAQTLESNPASQSVDTLAAAVGLYQGEFLADAGPGASAEFELWLLNERARYRRLYQRGLSTLVRRLIEQGDLQGAIHYGQALVQNDPLLEEAHAQLIWLYGRSGQREAALAQYEQCRVLLQRELAVEPAPELRALRDEIVAGLFHRPYLQPVVAAELMALRPAAGDFVGRDAEMARMHRVWASLPPGRSLVVILAAAAGMGKTRLAQEFARTIPEADFLQGDCYESVRALAYAPWLELLEARLARLSTDALEQLSPLTVEYLSRLLPALAQRLKRSRPALLPVTGGELSRLFAAVSEFLLELPQTRPLLIFLDNLQWADEASLQLFHYLVRRSPPGKVLFIGAFRPEESGEIPALEVLVSDLQHRSPIRLPLSPLAPEAIAQLAGRLWPALPPAERPQAGVLLFRATGGNPLFVTEVLREVAHLRSAPATLPVPPGVNELVQRRLNRLPGSGRQVIEALAVVAAPVTPAQAQQASGRSEEETILGLDLALRQGLLQPQREPASVRYDFCHDLIRQAVTGQISLVRRQLLHRRAAVLLEQAGSPAATLAYHWQMAGDSQQEGHYRALAGEQAAAMYANEEAARYLTRALALLTAPARRAHVMRRLGEVLLLLGRYQEARDLYERALALAGTVAERSTQARCRVALGRLARLKGDYAGAMSWLEQARRDYQALDDLPGMADTLWGLGAVYWSQLDYERALACFQEQLAIGRQLNDRQLIGKAVGSMAVAYAEQGDYAPALACYNERLQIDLALGDRLSLAKTTGNMGIVYTGLGHYSQALACYHFLLKVTVELGDRPNAAVAVGNMIGAYTEQGDYALAERLSRQAIALGRALDVPLYLCEFLYNTAELMARQERNAAAIALCDEAAAMATAIGRSDIQLPANLLSTRLRLADGEIDRTTAVATLKSWLDAWPEDQQQAAVLYELCRLDANAADLRRQAAGLYKKLYTRTPNITYRRRYQELAGETVPPPPAVSSPPEFVSRDATNLQALLEQVDRLLSEV
jgi:DNA-binding SARP family transcriptional activator/tetratricopeptide (TPR) repeat protein